MSTMVRSRAFHVWLFLVAVTLLSWYLSSVHTASDVTRDHATVFYTLAVLMIGFIKAWAVVRYFMEAREAPRKLKTACDVWLVLVAATILSFYPLGLW